MAHEAAPIVKGLAQSGKRETILYPVVDVWFKFWEARGVDYLGRIAELSY
jgi:hypothetical protein